MKASLIILSTLAAVASAHSTVYGVWVNDVFQGDGRDIYIRSPPNNDPVKDITIPAINCNFNNRQVPSSVSVKAGDKFTFEWYHDYRGDDIIASSHKGPITVYIAPASSNGAGAVWTKLYEDGLSGGVWAVDKLIANQGKHSLTLPSWIAPGSYLLRAEIIGLHEASFTYQQMPIYGAQFYPSCTQITVTSGGATVPAQNFNFVGGYQPTDPGILYNIYVPTLPPYTIPGPAVWSPSSSGSVAKWGQCGGTSYTGSTTCVSGSTCVKINDFYSQCQ